MCNRMDVTSTSHTRLRFLVNRTLSTLSTDLYRMVLYTRESPSIRLVATPTCMGAPAQPHLYCHATQHGGAPQHTHVLTCRLQRCPCARAVKRKRCNSFSLPQRMLNTHALRPAAKLCRICRTRTKGVRLSMYVGFWAQGSTAGVWEGRLHVDTSTYK